MAAATVSTCSTALALAAATQISDRVRQLLHRGEGDLRLEFEPMSEQLPSPLIAAGQRAAWQSVLQEIRQGVPGYTPGYTLKAVLGLLGLGSGAACIRARSGKVHRMLALLASDNPPQTHKLYQGVYARVYAGICRGIPRLGKHFPNPLLT